MLGYGVISGFGLGFAYIVPISMLQKWFPDKRGLITGLAVAGFGSAVAASAFWASPGHELWHPAPQFYYQPGGGPLFDKGPYYLSTLVTLLGPVVRVSGATSRSSRRREVATGPNAGLPVDVAVDTNVSALLEHLSGVTSTITVRFDVWASRHPRIEVYGTSGTVAVPDPNRFSDPVQVWTVDAPEWGEVPATAGYVDAARGFGLAEMARAIATNHPHRASGQLAFHVLDIMDAIARSGHGHKVLNVTSTVGRPAPVPVGARPDSW